MSYILEALKKADRERVAGHVPDLETVHRHEPTPRKPPRWFWILAALFVFNAILVALLAGRRDAGRDEEEVVPRAASGERIAALPEPAHPQTPVESPPPVRAPPAKIPKVAPRIPVRAPEAVAARPARVTRPATVPATTSAAPAAVERSAPAAAATPPAGPSPTSAPDAGKIPEWDELSLDFRSGLSMPRMDVHVYDPDPRRRFVLMDMQKIQEGDRLPNGAVLEKILPDGIELSYQGKRFHYGK